MNVVTLDPLGGSPPEPDWTVELPGRSKEIAAERITASGYWHMIVRELLGANKLAPVNGHSIKRLVLAWLLYDRAAAQVLRHGAVVPAPKTRTAMHNPWHTVMTQASKSAAAIETELTLSPRARDDGGKVPPPPRGARAADAYLKPAPGKVLPLPSTARKKKDRP